MKVANVRYIRMAKLLDSISLTKKQFSLLVMAYRCAKPFFFQIIIH